MMKEDAWAVFRLSTTEKMRSQNFEYSLILEDSDGTLEVIDIQEASNQNLSWLEVSYERDPVDLDNVDVLVKENLTLLSSCFVNVRKLLESRVKLAYIYFWTIAKQEIVYLEVLYPLSEIKNIVTKKEDKFFLQLYPQIPSEKFETLEDGASSIRSLEDLLSLFKQQNEEQLKSKISNLQKDDADIKSSNLDLSNVYLSDIELNFDIDSTNDDSSLGMDLSNKKSNTSNEKLKLENQDCIQKIFSKQDLKDLVEGFNDWQRAHGKNELINKLPESLISKMGDTYQIAFWTSGQGVSNMIRDNNPPRHTMVLSIIQTSSQQGIGYCIQRPTSLDKVWTHKKWHDLKYSDGEILEVVAIDSK